MEILVLAKQYCNRPQGGHNDNVFVEAAQETTDRNNVCRTTDQLRLIAKVKSTEFSQYENFFK